MKNRITIESDNNFHSGWVWACMGMELPINASLDFKEGYDTAIETPSLGTVQYIMRKSIERGQHTVTLKQN